MNINIGGSGSEKTNALLSLIKQQDDNEYSVIDKKFLYVKDPNEAKYQYLHKKREKNGHENLKNLRLLLNIQIICRMSIRILKSTTKAENVMY